MLVGDIEVSPLLDAVGELGELAELYPDVAAEYWEPYRALYPDLFTGPRWRLPCTCYLVRATGTTVLVDTGVGPPGLWGWEAEQEGGLPPALDALGIGRDDVDIVFLTHLHIDHLGWNTDAEADVYFPRARYIVHRDAVAFALSRPELPHIRRCVEPLKDRFEQLDGDADLVRGVTAFAAPGHYPGHMAVRIESEEERAVVLADIAVHPALLDRPEWRYVSDLDYDRCVETRRALLDELVDSDVTVACGHYPEGGIGRVVHRNGRVVWEGARH
jgi:glyoxylase-like metal-dependent hydrolase (beta-lactamase superfamily II)